MGKTESTENSENWINKKFAPLSVFWVLTGMDYKCQPLWKKWKLKLKKPLHKYQLYRKNSNDHPHKVLVSGFHSVNKNGISISAILKKMEKWLPFFHQWPSVSAIMKKMEKWLPFCKYQSYRNISNYWPYQSLGLRFSKCWWKWNISVGHYKKNWKWPPFCKYHMYRKISNYWPHPQSVDRNGILVLVIMKKLKNGCHFINIDCTKKFKLPTPLQFSECLWKWNISVGHYEVPFRKY